MEKPTYGTDFRARSFQWLDVVFLDPLSSHTRPLPSAAACSGWQITHCSGLRTACHTIKKGGTSPFLETSRKCLLHSHWCKLGCVLSPELGTWAYGWMTVNIALRSHIISHLPLKLYFLYGETATTRFAISHFPKEKPQWSREAGERMRGHTPFSQISSVFSIFTLCHLIPHFLLWTCDANEMNILRY